MAWEMELGDRKLEELYEWIDQIPLSRPKKRIERDFSDGCMVAEIVRYHLPHLIDLHNYTPANNIDQKKANWGMLNSKVFARFGLNVPEAVTHNICVGKPGYVEVLLYNLRYKVQEAITKFEKKNNNGANTTLNGSKTPRSQTVMDTSRVLNVKSRLSDQNGKNLPAQMVPRMDYEVKVQENLEQAEALEVLQAKIRRLEHLLQLKDIRIQDLSDRLDKFRPTAPAGPPHKPIKY
jgi:hypothetical protein